jgi:phage tail-like protein
MDSNKTRFHLLFMPDDWAQGTLEQVEWNAERRAIGLRPLPFIFPTVPGEPILRPEDRRGAAQDRYGNWYWIGDDQASLRFAGPGERASVLYWSVSDLAALCPPEPSDGSFGPAQPATLPTVERLCGLAVTQRHYLVVGTHNPGGLLIFDLRAGGTPLQMTWPVAFKPFDMAADADGGVWVLDRDHKKLWHLDCYFRIVTAAPGEISTLPPITPDFAPAGSAPQPKPPDIDPASLNDKGAISLAGLAPIAVEALPDGSALVLHLDLDGAGKTTVTRVSRFRAGAQRGSAALSAPIPGYTLRGHDMAFVPTAETAEQPVGAVRGALFVAVQESNQTFAFSLLADPDLLRLERILPRFYPMRLFAGKGLVNAGGQVYYDMADRWVRLVEQPRPRFETLGRITSFPLDGKVPDCIWHRLCADVCFPPDTDVHVETRTGNTPADLLNADWQPEPRLVRRGDGAEVPYYAPYERSELRNGLREQMGTWDVLFQRATGRYLQLRLTLIGTGRSSPFIRAARVYYPRFSYLREYLPAAYQDEDVASGFVERFLANVEGFFTSIEGRIAEVQTLFDVRTTDPAYLDWLAGWFGVLFDPSWDTNRRRLFIAHAIDLFNQRGTLRGLIRAIRLATDDCPDESLFDDATILPVTGASERRIDRFGVRIVERYLTRSIPGVSFGDPADVSDPGEISAGAPWEPSQGVDVLHQRWRDYLIAHYGSFGAIREAWGKPGLTTLAQLRLSPVVPANAVEATDWQRFTRQRRIGFTYAEVSAGNPEDVALYRQFLAGRYPRIAVLNTAYAATYAGFEQIALPAEAAFPTTNPRLFDWIQFVTLALPIVRHAHRFSVLLPTDPRQPLDAQAKKVALVRRVVEAEKPAHTDFDVRQYWALFRVGEARLGLDTLLDAGSRFIAIVLGSAYLAEGYLSAAPPFDAPDRFVAGRDTVDSNRVL